MAGHNILGAAGEYAAMQYLTLKGYRIRDTNWRYHHLELDIVAENDDYIVFVEVKTRSSVHFANPEDAVDYRKMKHLINAAEAYMAINNIDKDFRFDILAIAVIGNRYHFNHIEDAFMPPVL
ncbi:MAG: YraN family protein [Bacteroidetes bacterium]|uniref:UPF0102 protein IAC32_01420 n=1 Tax=Candidatus Enterocola intestinipullorum TaxID=2840783 RepID=A0A9D9EGE3_9BACT|nr:YraN family protein [Candidatus Enterocola intestinipullorum]